jgi:hypothetical protein
LINDDSCDVDDDDDNGDANDDANNNGKMHNFVVVVFLFAGD